MLVEEFEKKYRVIWNIRKTLATIGLLSLVSSLICLRFDHHYFMIMAFFLMMIFLGSTAYLGFSIKEMGEKFDLLCPSCKWPVYSEAVRGRLDRPKRGVAYLRTTGKCANCETPYLTDIATSTSEDSC